MQIQVGDKKYTVGFAYLRGEKPKTRKEANIIRTGLEAAVSMGKFPDYLKEKQPIATAAYIKENDTLLAVGASVCSTEDNFSRRAGRNRALSRALLNMSEDRNVRKAFGPIFEELNK